MSDVHRPKYCHFCKRWHDPAEDCGLGRPVIRRDWPREDGTGRSLRPLITTRVERTYRADQGRGLALVIDCRNRLRETARIEGRLKDEPGLEEVS